MPHGIRAGWVITLLVLLFTGCIGLYNGITEWKDAGTMLQKSVTAGVFLYGFLGVLAFGGLLMRQAWSIGPILVWGIVVTYVAGVAVIAYGGSDASVGGAVVGALVTAAIATAMTWISIRATRHSDHEKKERVIG